MTIQCFSFPHRKTLSLMRKILHIQMSGWQKSRYTLKTGRVTARPPLRGNLWTSGTVIPMSQTHRQPVNINPTESSHVSGIDHAVQKYQQRVDGGEPRPRSTIRRAFEKGPRVEFQDPSVHNPAHVHDGAADIFDSGKQEIITVLRPRREQLPEREQSQPCGLPDASASWREERAHQGVPRQTCVEQEGEP